MNKINLNLQGMPCPMPLIRLKKTLAGLENDTQIYMTSSDRGALKDIPAFCAQQKLDVEILNKDVPFEFLIHFILKA